MGFYGNITSTNKTQFTFDRIYPNRRTMEEALIKDEDGVFIGRFVLIEYDGENATYFPIFKGKENINEVFYADSANTTIMDLNICKKDDIFQYQAGNQLEYWKATGEIAKVIIDGNEVEYAVFQPIDLAYENNYVIDLGEYGPGRGYDGTVWQKVYSEGTEKYVMIAELNSIVPTFKVTADAPTMTPLEPHFDKQSNNVTYWLHWQPQWGMRVKEAPSIPGKDGNPVKYSDTEVTWINSVYNPVTHQVDETQETKAGNIYFNKAGLSKEIRSHNEMEDQVSVTPTGISGYKYQGHGVEPQEAEDIQEISIILPSIGNAISDAWDIVYGVPKNADNKRNLDIDWDSLKGIRMVEDGTSGYKYNSKNANSLAGCINSVHDLMGMIIMEESVEDPKDADANSIYYNNKTGKFERKHTTYTYKEVESISDENTFEEVLGIDLLKWEKNKYHYKDSLKNYFLETSTKPDKSRNYYEPKFNEQSLTPKYIQYKWWYKDGLNYMFGNEKEAKPNTDYYEVNREASSFTWYKKETYFYKDCLPTEPEDMTKPYLIASHDLLNKNYTYFSIDSKYNIKDLPEQTITYEQSPGEFITVKTKIIPSDANLQKINLTQFENNKYYNCDYDFTYVDPETNLSTGDFILITTEPEEKHTLCFTLNPKKIHPFYQADIYYYKQENNYLKDRSGEYNEEKVYYKLEVENQIEKEFYVEGEYFEKIDGSYIPSMNTTPDSNKNYYKKKEYYVIKDELEELPVGMEWNSNIKTWPSTLHIGTCKEKYEMQELPGFARSFNTIHGLILEIKKLLDTGHIYTRDINTVQGSINKLNDIIAKFENLQPGKMILIDNYGRINSANYSTNKWLEWEVDTNPTNLNIGIKHLGAQEVVTNISQGNKNPKFGETITTPEIAIDANGHINSIINEEVALPKPSLIVNGSGVLTSTSLIAETGELTANYTALSDVKLDGYGKTTATGDILATDSLETGLSKLENAIAFTNDALEEVDAQLREDFAAEDTAIRSEFAAEDAAIRSEFATVDTAIRAEFAAADTTLQNNINNINTSLGNRITAIENKNDFGVGALTTRVEANENKLTGISTTVADSITNAVNELSAGQVETNKQSIEGLNTRVSTVETTLKDVPSVGAALESTHQRIGGIEDRVATIEDQFKGSDIAEDGTEIPRNYGLMKWYNQAFMPDTPNGEMAVWFDTNAGEIKLYNGTMWVVLTATAI